MDFVRLKSENNAAYLGKENDRVIIEVVRTSENILCIILDLC